MSRAPAGVKKTPRIEMALKELKSASGYKINTHEVILNSPGQSEMGRMFDTALRSPQAWKVEMLW